MRLLILFGIVLFLFSTLVTANSDYLKPGGNNTDFVLGTGFFNSEEDTVNINDKLITRVAGTPVVGDLDGDGYPEIVYIDGSELTIRENFELDFVASLALAAGTSSDPNYFLFDIDDDAYLEVIVSGRSENRIRIYEYNGTDFYEENNFTGIGFDNANNDYRMMGCRDDQICMIAGSDRHTCGVAITPNYRVATFNSTQIIDILTLHSTVLECECNPAIPVIAIENYDKLGGDDEFILSYFYSTGTFGQDDFLKISYLDVDIDGQITLINTITRDLGHNVYDASPGGSCASNDYGKFLTSPLVFDRDNVGGQMETVIGYMESTEDFRIRVYNSVGSQVDVHPDVGFGDGEGVLISNVIRMNAFPDTDDVDYCVAGANDDGVFCNNQINLVCGNKDEGTNEFDYCLEGDGDPTEFNLSTDAYNWERIMHSGQHDTTLTDGKDLSELITSYGTFRIDYEGINELLLLWPNPYQNSVVVAVDVEGIEGRDNMLVMTSANIIHIDDGYVNSGAEIDLVNTNPCINSTWKINTSASITVTTFDADADTVQSRVVMYYNDANQQNSSWSSLQPSGTPISFSDFEVNKTIGVGTIRILARDSGQPTEVDIQDLTFSVGSNGVEFGDCTSSIDFQTSQEEEEDEAEDEAAVGRDPEDDNAVETALDAIAGDTGLGTTVLWLIVMVAVGMGIWYYGHKEHANFTAGAFVTVEGLLFVAGAKLGFFGVGTVLILVILGVIVISLKFRRITTGA